METTPTLVVLAAGMGSRYGGLKQMDGIGPSQETLLEYSIFDALRAGFSRIVFIIRRSIEEDFRQRVLMRLPARIAYDLAFQEIDALPDGVHPPAERTKPWGTAHALWCAQQHINAPFAVINADDFYGRQAFSSLAAWLTAKHKQDDCCMVGYSLPHTLSKEGSVSRGVCQIDDAGWLKSIVEHTKIERQPNGSIVDLSNPNRPIPLSDNTIVSMNCWGFLPSIIPFLNGQIAAFFKEDCGNAKAECYIPSVVEAALLAGATRCQVLHSESQWCGITYPGDRPFVEQTIERLVHQGEYPPSLW